MGFTQYYNYKNPILEMNQVRKQKEKFLLEGRRENIWVEFDKFVGTLPTDETFIKRIQKHIVAFKNISKDVKKLLANLPESVNEEPLIIRGGDGKGKPVVNEREICLNGDEKDDMCHESFCVSLFDQGAYFNTIDKYNSKKGIFNFCKTARKPYDIVVCVCLLICKHYLGDDIAISSDGNLEEWMPAIELYEQVFKRDARKSLVKSLIGKGEEQMYEDYLKEKSVAVYNRRKPENINN